MSAKIIVYRGHHYVLAGHEHDAGIWDTLKNTFGLGGGKKKRAPAPSGWGAPTTLNTPKSKPPAGGARFQTAPGGSKAPAGGGRNVYNVPPSLRQPAPGATPAPTGPAVPAAATDIKSAAEASVQAIENLRLIWFGLNSAVKSFGDQSWIASLPAQAAASTADFVKNASDAIAESSAAIKAIRDTVVTLTKLVASQEIACSNSAADLKQATDRNEQLKAVLEQAKKEHVQLVTKFETTVDQYEELRDQLMKCSADLQAKP